MTSTGERMFDGSIPTSVKLFFFCTFNHNINITVDPHHPLLLDCFFSPFDCRCIDDVILLCAGGSDGPYLHLC